MFLRIWHVAQGALRDFFKDRVPQFAAALSFYAAFSMAPLLILLLTAAAFLLDGAEVRAYAMEQITKNLGDQVSTAIDGMLNRASKTQPRGIAALVATAIMLIGGTAVIMSLKAALDHIFGTTNFATGRAVLMGIVTARFKAFAMVLILAGLLISSLMFNVIAGGISTVVSTSFIGGALPDWVDLAGWLNSAAGVCVVTLLFYIIYRFFPDRPPSGRAALVGALVSVVLLALGKRAISWYIGTVGTASAFGAAGALAVILVWIFISANIVLLGAECAKSCDRTFPDTKRPPTA